VLGLLIPFMLVAVVMLPMKEIGANYVIAIAMGYVINTSLAIIISGNLNNP
jgi:hypothetical protein